MRKGDPLPIVEFHHLSRRKIGSIVNHNFVWGPKPDQYVLLNEVSNYLGSSALDWDGFHPHGEVIYGSQHMGMPSTRRWIECSNEV